MVIISEVFNCSIHYYEHALLFAYTCKINRRAFVCVCWCMAVANIWSKFKVFNKHTHTHKFTLSLLHLVSLYFICIMMDMYVELDSHANQTVIYNSNKNKDWWYGFQVIFTRANFTLWVITFKKLVCCYCCDWSTHLNSRINQNIAFIFRLLVYFLHICFAVTFSDSVRLFFRFPSFVFPFFLFRFLFPFLFVASQNIKWMT